MRIIANKSGLTIFHGDNHNTSKLDPKLMNQGNNQEGIGIYFGNLKTAKNYGRHIVKTAVNLKKFAKSTDSLSDYISVSKLASLLKELHKVDPEPLYYDVTDWGIEVDEPSDIEDYHLHTLADNIIIEEVRNTQIDLANKFGVEVFVKLWNKIIKIDGTYAEMPDDTWVAIINPKYKLEKVQL